MAAQDTTPTGSAGDTIAGEILREFQILESKRGVWEGHWQEVAEKVLPYYSNSFYQQGVTTPGQKKNQLMFDTTANGALWKFAAAMESMITPANGKWHKVRHPNRDVMKQRDAQLWYDELNDALFYYRYSPHSGYQAQQHDSYVSIGAFGTGALFADEFKDPVRPTTRGLRYRHVHLGELFFAVNHQGQVDKVYRRFKMTLRQIEQKWPNRLPQGKRDRLATNPEDEVMVVHCVKPRENRDPQRLDSKGYVFASYYVLRETQTLLNEGGFRCFPYSVARYLTAPGELYGRGPAMNVLPNISVINEEKKTIIKQGHRVVDPVLLAHDDGILDGFSLRPGAVNYGAVNSDGRPLVHTLPTGNIAIGKELMDDERYAINDAFLVTLFQILVETPQMTATEVLERAREKGALLSPTMGRYQAEGIGPQIEREIDLLMWQGLVSPPPPMLREAGLHYMVEYDAPLNRAMRAEEAAGTMRSMQWASEIAAQTQDPSVMDWFETDTIIPEMVSVNGGPARYVRTPERVAQIRQQRSMNQAGEQLVQALPGIAAIQKASTPKGNAPFQGQGA